MAVALVQSAFAATADNIAVTTANKDTTGATSIVVAVVNFLDRFGDNVPVDSKSNTYLPLTKRGAALQSTVRWFYCHSPSVGSGHNWSLSTGSVNAYVLIFVYALSGTDTTATPTESGATATSNPTSIQHGGGLTPAANGAGIFALVGNNFNRTAGSWAVNGGFTISTIFTWSDGVHGAGAAAYLLQGSAAGVDPTWSALSTETSSGDDAASSLIVVEAVSVGASVHYPWASLLSGMGNY